MCVFQNNFMVKSELHEVSRVGKLTASIDIKYGALVSIVMVDIDESFDEMEWWGIGPYWVTKGVTGLSVSYGECGKISCSISC